jgi:hypothetical protein
LQEVEPNIFTKFVFCENGFYENIIFMIFVAIFEFAAILDFAAILEKSRGFCSSKKVEDFVPHKETHSFLKILP